MKIRPVHPSDAEQITAIFTHYTLYTISTFALDPPTIETTTKRLQQIGESQLPFLVLEDDTKRRVAGLASASPYNPERAGYAPTVENSIYLAPDYCGKGLGTGLLNEFLDQLAIVPDVHQVIARIAILPGEVPAVDSPSCKMHLKAGFRVVGRMERVGYKLGQWIDVAILQKGVHG